MKITASPSAGWAALAAWTEVRGARAQLAADLAAGADPQVIAADKASIMGRGHRLAQSASKIDLLV
jgi:hypothetical protein